MSNFIKNLRNKVTQTKGTKSDGHLSNSAPRTNPLDAYSLYNFNDVMNDIYIIDDLRQNGDEQGAKMAYDSFTRHGVVFNSADRSVNSFMKYVFDYNLNILWNMFYQKIQLHYYVKILKN